MNFHREEKNPFPVLLIERLVLLPILRLPFQVMQEIWGFVSREVRMTRYLSLQIRVHATSLVPVELKNFTLINGKTADLFIETSQ
jgi:hypothetical protein